MKKVITKTRKEILKKLQEEHKKFDQHLKDSGSDFSSNSCGDCRGFQGRIFILNWVLGNAENYRE